MSELRLEPVRSERIPGAGDAEQMYRHVNVLRRYAIALTGHPAEADDLVQETMERALTRLRGGGRIEHLRAFLLKVLRNAHLDRLVRERRAGLAVPLEDVDGQLSCPPPQIVYIECHEMVDALLLLPGDQREVVLLVGLHGHSYRSAAEVLGVPVGTVMSRLSRGRDRLRRLWE